MLSLLFTALAIYAADKPAPARSAGPDIVIQGKSNLVCTSTRITGSRVGRNKRCRTREQAQVEAEEARQALEQAGGLQRIAESLACGPGTPKSCD